MGAPPGLSHAGRNTMLPTKASFEDVRLPPSSVVATPKSGSIIGTLPIVAMPVPLAPQLEIMRLWWQKMEMGMGVGRGRRFHLLLLPLLCSCRVSLVLNAQVEGV